MLSKNGHSGLKNLKLLLEAERSHLEPASMNLCYLCPHYDSTTIFTTKINFIRKQPTFPICHHWFPCEMTCEENLQKFHSDDVVSLPRSGINCF